MSGFSFRHSLLLCTLVAFTGCATAGVGFEDRSPTDSELFGDFLAGSYANYVDDAPARSTYYARAFSRAQDNVNLGRRAVTSALTTGDIELARTLSVEVLSTSPNEPMARAVLGAREFAAGRHTAAAAYFDEPTKDLTVSIVMGIMAGWNYAALGNEAKAIQAFSTLGGGPYFETLGQLQKGKYYAQTGNFKAAQKAFAVAGEADFSGEETALSTARAQAAAGDFAAAKATLKTYIADYDAFEIGIIGAYMADLEQGIVPDAGLTPLQEASRSLTEPAIAFFYRNRAADAAEVFLRMALTLDPNHDKAKVWLGGILENSNRQAEAMEIYQSLEDSSYYIVSAQLSQANIYFDRDEDANALALLEDANNKHPSFVTREALGRARLVRENYVDALPIYDALVKSLSDEEIRQNSQPLYFRGICYERTKQFDLAVKDFKRVLEIDPEDADALNYLGYTWVDRGENLTEAFEMIRKAVRLQPESGAIVDSLGWAHYKLGDYQEAKVELEKAVELSPASATIIDHLGDVYWKLGRFREAGFQWQRALEYDPTDEERAEIRLKLKSGLQNREAMP